MALTVVIPARMASSRFPDKPLVRLAGRPLIEWVCRSAQAVQGVERVVVATDSARIQEAVTGFGGQVVMTDQSHASGTDRVAQAARLLKLGPEERVVNLQGDQPLCPSALVEKTASLLDDDPDLGLATAAVPLPNELASDPDRVKVVLDSQGYALYFSRAPIPYARDERTKVEYLKHLGIYAFRNRFLQTFTGLPQGVLEQVEMLEQLRALEQGFRIKVAVTPDDSPAVDSPQDVDHIESLLVSDGS